MGVSFMAQTVDAQNVSVGGQVMFSDSPSPCSVVLSGPVGATLSTDAWGNFGYFGPASGLGTVTATVTDSDGNVVEGWADVMHNPPQVSSLSAGATGVGKQVAISGCVDAETPGGLEVDFDGSAGLAAASTTTDAYGNFSLLTTASNLGYVTAVVTDDWGVQSWAMGTDIMDMGAQISNLQIEATGQGKQVDVSGSVSAPSPGGLTVNFGGSAGLADSSTTTDADGNFDLITTASSLGDVSATVTDIWGMQSPASDTMLMVMAPQITSFGAIDMGGGLWKFQGVVSGSGVGDDTIQLSGLGSATVTPNADGYFSVELALGCTQPNGEEYAVATDVWGQTSNQANRFFWG